MKFCSKILYVAFVFLGLPAFATEAPAPTFSIWGEPNPGPLGYYNLVKNLTGQEFVGFTVNCLDGGTGPYDTFVIKAQVFNSATGVFRYEIAPSIDSPNNTQGDPVDCAFNSLGLGVAVSGKNRVLVFGMTEAENAVIYGYNAETGSQLYKLTFPRIMGDYNLAMPGNTGEWSSVGNFLNDKNDQLRVAYVKGSVSPGPIEIKITYYDVLTGVQFGDPLPTITVPAP